jgi:hypothetical protein
LLLDELAKVIYYVLFVRGLAKLGGIHLIDHPLLSFFLNFASFMVESKAGRSELGCKLKYY